MIDKLILIFSTFFLVRRANVGETNLRYIGIASNTSELDTFRQDGIYEKAMAVRFKEDSKKSKFSLILEVISGTTAFYIEKYLQEAVIVGNRFGILDSYID